MDHRCVPRQVLPSNPRYEGCAIGSFAILSKEASRFFGTGDVSFEQGMPDNVIDGMMTQRTTRSLPTHKAVMALRPKPVAALALMGGTQGQTKAEANCHPDCVIVEGNIIIITLQYSSLLLLITNYHRPPPHHHHHIPLLDLKQKPLVSDR